MKMRLLADLERGDWREILQQIIADVKPAEERASCFRSINGIIANAHGALKLKKTNYNIESVYAACYQRMAREGLMAIIEHQKFERFLNARVSSTCA